MSNVSDKIAEFAKNLSVLEQAWEALKQEVDAKFVRMKTELESVQAKVEAPLLNRLSARPHLKSRSSLVISPMQ